MLDAKGITMYAVIKTGGKQYRITKGDEVKFEKLEGEVGDAITFDRVLLTSDGETVRLGNPCLENSKVIGRILGRGKNRKVLVFKYRRRKGYRKTRGHRQQYTLVKIENIES